MKNKLLIVLFIVFIFSIPNYAQERVVGVSYTKTTVDNNFHINKVFYKQTGRKIPVNEFHKLVKENPNLFLEKEFDQEGNVVRYLYDPNDQNENRIQAQNKNIPIKSDFPNFKLTTIERSEIEMKDLEGKLIILRFELFANDFRFKKHEIQELDKKINASENKEDIKAIIVFQCSENEVRKGFDLKDSNFELVANGQNFIDKFGISRFPSTLLIDQNGNLINRFSYSEDIILEEHLKK